MKICHEARWSSTSDRPTTKEIGRISLLEQRTMKKITNLAHKAAYCHLKGNSIKKDHHYRSSHSKKADLKILKTVSINSIKINFCVNFFTIAVEISKDASQNNFPDSNTKKNSLVSPGSDGSMAALD